MTISGFYELKTPNDLLAKAKRDFEMMRLDKSNVDLAFNFFVTIEHMPDWLRIDKRIKNSNPILRVTSHLASGAKHMVPFESYKSVKSVQKDSVYEDGVYEDCVFDKWLAVNLDGDEVAIFNTSKLDVIDLGERIIKFWEDYLDRWQQPT